MLTIDDIEARWRPLTDEEKAVAATLIEDVIAWAHTISPKLQSRLDADTTGNFKQNVKRILAGAVIRVLKNPDAYKTEQDGSYSYTLDRAISSGELAITGAALRSLIGRSRGSSMSLRDPGLPLIAPDRAGGPFPHFMEVDR